MDLESVADELYGLPPEDFTDARRRHAAAARASGDRGLATRITSLRRPTLSAWACNLLVRADPDQAAGLLRLGEELRQAHQELDRDQMRELGSRRNRLVGALSRQVRDLAAEAGHPVSESVLREVEATLQAVLADPDAAAEWATGQLARPLSPPVGFTEAALAAATRRPAPTTALATPATAPEAPAARKDGRKAQEKELARARQDAETAEQRAREQEEALREAESEHERAETLLEQTEERAVTLAEDVRRAEDRLRAARRELDEARAEEGTARTARDGARKRVSETRRAAGQARRDARSAGDRVEALEAEGGQSRSQHN
ncbi:hypothetical protein ABZ729_04580 [Streptomyces sp. NPDC006678]|uniref:hypothetical protein n=1 Tax=Streptomyces sp. NPDC006678 TaxID=3157185 RepID=UPI0033FD1511